jgi:hypothetical protein
MANSRENSIWHLTPEGWVVSEAPPPDRVETWNCCVEEAGRSKRYVEWTRIWTNPSVAPSQRDRLRKRFWGPDGATVLRSAKTDAVS